MAKDKKSIDRILAINEINGIEYIYRHRDAWDVKTGKIFNIENKIVNDVILRERHPGQLLGGYEFTCKETGQRFRCNYGWAFVENTPENYTLYLDLKKTEEEYDKIRKLYKLKLKNIKTLPDLYK